MADYIRRQDEHDYILYSSKYKSIRNFIIVRNKVKHRIVFLLPILYVLSPVLFFSGVIMLLVLLWDRLFAEYFTNMKKLQKYISLFSPKASREVLSVIGYQVYPEEAANHINIVKDGSEQNKKKLGRMSKKFQSENERYRHVGFSKDLLVTHFIIVGKTGAGKTEGVRSISDDILKMGGGLLFNDGKSDEAMLREFQSQATRNRRETSSLILNLLKAEKMGESNTFSPITIMHPIKIIEFLGSLAGGGNSGGNADYFFKRGKAMLLPIANMLYTRNKFFEEGFSVEMLFSNSSIHDYFFNTIVVLCMDKERSEKIKYNQMLFGKVSTVRTTTLHPFLEEIEKSIEYITQNPAQAYIFKEEIGLDFVDIKEIYSNCYVLMYSWLTKIWNPYAGAINLVGRTMFAMAKSKGHVFIGDGALSIKDIKHLYVDLKDILNTNEKSELEDFVLQNDLEKWGVKEQSIIDLKEVFYKDKGGTAENPPADAVQQHNYAQQQWDTLEGIFSMYKHVFGQSKPEIKPEKLLKENKFLYAVLPPLELQGEQTEILGKMLIMTIREIAAIALGGERLSIHLTLANIFKDKRRPKPFTFVILDEYGAYPVEGIDLLLAQLRSLSISVAISTQVYADLAASGDNNTSKQKNLGNTTKWILKTEDEDTIEWARKMISKVKTEKQKMQKDASGHWAATAEVDVEEEEAIKAEIMRNFANGFSLLLLGSEEDDAVFLQSFYRGGEAKNILVRRYDNIASI